MTNVKFIKVGNHEIVEKEFKGKRVVTFKEIDLVHERPEGTAGRNFRENKNRFIEGEDYYAVKPSDIQDDEIRRSEINNAGTYLITEQGYLMLVKSFTDDLAWTIQRQLVNNYFNKPKPLSATEQIRLQLQAIGEIDERVTSIDKDLQDFKQDMPILGIEESKITSAVKRKGVQCLGGKNTEAYKDKSLRRKVFADIYGQIKRWYGVASYKSIKRNQCEGAVEMIERYKLPFVLKEQVKDINSQMELWEDDVRQA